MKNIAILLILISITITSCVGERGPTGPQGPAGIVGQGFEVQASFTESNDYSQIFEFPGSIEVLSTDIVITYLLWDVDPNTGNDIWQQLPVSVFFSDGQLQYAFDHTLADIKLFLTGDTDLSTVGDEFTQDQIFRVAILPVDYVQSKNVNLQNMNEVMEVIGEENIPKIDRETYLKKTLDR